MNMEDLCVAPFEYLFAPFMARTVTPDWSKSFEKKCYCGSCDTMQTRHDEGLIEWHSTIGCEVTN